MTALELLTAMGNTRDSYLLAAQEARSAPIAAPRARRRISRGLLIAAILALMLVLVGCVAVFLGLQQLSLEETDFTESAHFDKEGNWVEQTQGTRHFLSLQGFAGSANQQAQAEWRAFLDSYDPDGTILTAARESPADLPEHYRRIYHCYTQEMADKLDEITAKYGLGLYQTHLDVTVGAPFLLDSLGIPGWIKDGSAETEYSGYGELYDNGSFKMAASVTLPQDSHWPYQTWLQLTFSYKDCFDPNTQKLENLDTYREWNYRTSDGTELLLAMNGDYALMIADREDAFLTVNLESFYRQKNVNAPDFNQITYMEARELELLAETVDFSILPRVADMEAASRELAELERKQQEELDAIMETYEDPNRAASFSDLVRTRLEQYSISQDIYYALYDLNSDRQEELFIGGAADGSFGEVVFMEDGETKVYGMGGMLEGIYLCEGNILEYADVAAIKSPNGVDDKRWFVQFTPEGSQRVDWIALSYARDPENPWFTDTSGFGATWGWTPITEEEYNAVLAKYTRMEIETYPLIEYPLD